MNFPPLEPVPVFAYLYHVPYANLFSQCQTMYWVANEIYGVLWRRQRDASVMVIAIHPP